MEYPLISVIMPAYNCENYIRKAIDSVLLQNMPLELLVINDCSTDGTCQAVAPYLPDPRVRYVENERNLGVAATRNKGVDLAVGEYVAFLDADDWWASDKLRKQMDLILKQGVVLCSTGRELVDEDGVSLGKVIPVKEKITYQMLLRQNCINCSSVLLKREVAQAYPMEHEDSHEDYIAWLRILKEYGRASAVNEPLLKYRLSSSGKSGSKLKSARMTFQAYRYMGFSYGKSLLCFVFYAINGLWKYR